MPVSRVSQEPTWLLSRANARAQRLLSEAFGEHSLRPLHYRTLAALQDHGDLSQVALGGHLGLDRKDVAVALDLLADRGLVERRQDPDDGRRNLVSLTDAGQDLVPALDRTLAEVQDRVLEPLAPAEQVTLTSLLRKLGE